jgi:ferredoxin
MATMIVADLCINCGACVSECPNDAISEGESAYVIDPEACTECVGFADEERCQSVCPDSCCLPDPQRAEAESVLLARAQRLHPELCLPQPLPARLSRFANPHHQR